MSSLLLPRRPLAAGSALCGACATQCLLAVSHSACSSVGGSNPWSDAHPSARTFQRRFYTQANAGAATHPSSFGMAQQNLGQPDASAESVTMPMMNATGGALPITYTPGSGPGGALAAPSTVITEHCNSLSEALSKADELQQQILAQEAAGGGAEILTREAMDEFVEELKSTASTAITAMVDDVRSTPQLMQKAGMHELRRALFYTTSLKERDWIEEAGYTSMMRALTVELIRRDNDGVMSPEDVLYVSTHVITANFYNRHLWNRMESSMLKFSNFEHVDISSIKAFTTKLFKTRRGCPPETLDIRRKILSAMSRRVGVLANDFDLPSLLGLLQCYTVHDLTPYHLEPLAVRATNHVADFTPHECATLGHVLRKWRLMRLEVCERIVERICTSDQLSHHMANSAMINIRHCFNKVSDGGRNAMNAEPMRQKLRALGEQVGCRLDEVDYPALPVVLGILDVVVSMKIYIPKKCLQAIFSQANDMLAVVMEQRDDLVDPKTKKHVRPITAEEGRQLQALLFHYSPELCPELHARLKEAFKEGILPDEASML